MPLTESDFFSWYSTEITRYRNIEWKLAGYSIGFSYASVLFAKNHLVPDILSDAKILAVLMAVFVLSLLLVELHVHKRLNDFRAKRDALEEGEPNHRKIKGKIWKRRSTKQNGPWRDQLFLIAFIAFPLIVGIFAFAVLWQTRWIDQ